MSSAFDAFVLGVGPWALLWSVVFSMHFARYVAASGLVALAVERVPALQRARLQQRASVAQRRVELRSSLKAGSIFALQFLPLAYAIHVGWTRVYFDVESFGWPYLFASFFLALILHDAYFYWTHRWMHHPRVFRTVHLHHHLSRSPSAWAAFSFHPLESLVEGGIHLVIPLVMPIHISVLGAFVVWATFHSAIIHSGHDVFLGRRSFTRWINGPLEHDAHHGGAPGNFALYFSFWDRLMGTRV